MVGAERSVSSQCYSRWTSQQASEISDVNVRGDVGVKKELPATWQVLQWIGEQTMTEMVRFVSSERGREALVKVC